MRMQLPLRRRLLSRHYLCIVRSRSTYGTRKELGGGEEELNAENWIIDINEAFDIALTKLDEDHILQYGNSKVVIRCSESFWEFAVYSSPKSPYQDFLLKLIRIMVMC